MKNKNNISSDAKYILLEQYRIAVDIADRMTARKETSNKLFISAHAVIFTYLASQEFYSNTSLFVPVFGIFLCFIWVSIIRNYKILNNAKFEVIEEMETRLPWNVFKSEWDKLGRGRNKNIYQNMSSLELKIPFLFALLYFIFFFVNAWYF